MKSFREDHLEFFFFLLIFTYLDEPYCMCFMPAQNVLLMYNDFKKIFLFNNFKMTSDLFSRFMRINKSSRDMNLILKR